MKEHLKKYWIFYIVIFILLYIIVEIKKDLNTAHLNHEKLSSDIEYYKLKNNSLVSSKRVLELNNEELKKHYSSSKEILKKFNKPQVVVKTITEIKVDTIKIVYDKPIEVDFKRSGELFTKDYNFTYESDKNGLKIANFKLAEDTATFIIGDKKKWLLGEKVKTIDINHSNPLIKDISIDASLLNENIKWYESKWFYLGIGILTGTLIIK